MRAWFGWLAMAGALACCVSWAARDASAAGPVPAVGVPSPYAPEPPPVVESPPPPELPPASDSSPPRAPDPASSVAPASAPPRAPAAQPPPAVASQLPRALSPRRAHPFGLAFVSGVFGTSRIPLPLPYAAVSLGFNVGPFLLLEGAVTLPVPMAIAGGRVFFGRGEVAGYLAARYGTGFTRAAFGPGLGVDASRDDGGYSFAEAGLLWDRESSFTRNQVGNAIGKVGWAVDGLYASFGIGKRF